MKTKFIGLFLIALSLISCNIKEPKDFATDQELFQKATQYYNKKNYTDAVSFYEEIRARFPMSPHMIESELKLGEAHFKKGDYLEAEMALNSFKTLHPTHAQTPYVTYLLGETHSKRVPRSASRDQTQAKHAVRVFSEFLRRYPDSEYAQKAKDQLQKNKDKLVQKDLMVGSFYLKQKKYEAAVLRLNEVIESEASQKIKTDASYKKALALYKSGKKEESKSVLNDVITTDPAYTKAKKLMKKVQ